MGDAECLVHLDLVPGDDLLEVLVYFDEGALALTLAQQVVLGQNGEKYRAPAFRRHQGLLAGLPQQPQVLLVAQHVAVLALEDADQDEAALQHIGLDILALGQVHALLEVVLHGLAEFPPFRVDEKDLLCDTRRRPGAACVPVDVDVPRAGVHEIFPCRPAFVAEFLQAVVDERRLPRSGEAEEEERALFRKVLGGTRRLGDHPIRVHLHVAELRPDGVAPHQGLQRVLVCLR
mmetsp:Transcript_18624/g.52651  ORF Transcript_18624/g.52651 Transcript_18624/m.52651 type:complete len:233 (+) Transcript_18624:341-1039(+)